MSLRYKGGLISPSVNPLAANITTSPNVAQYNGVFTLQQQGQAITSGQWATDPYYKNTTLLLHADGKANGSQNNTFLDSSTNNFTITRNGNTTQGSFTPYGPDWSVNFGSTSGDNGIYLAAQSAFAFGTGDFTIEMWVNLQPVTSLQTLIDFRPSSTQGLYPTVYLDTATATLRYYTNTSDVITGSTTFTYGTWHHVAVCRSGTSTKLFLDGVQQGSTYTDSNNYLVGSGRPYTGYGISSAGYMMYGGYLSNLRIMKGQALYTSAFTPSTTPLTTTSQGATAANVSLLTAQSNRFVDNSNNGFALNIAGTVSVQRFSPFPPQYQYTPAVIGGSGYFDGAGDYLSVAANAAFTFGTGAFSIESWVYGNSGDVFGNLTFTASNDSVRLRCNTGTPSLETWNVVLANSTIALTANAWNHLVGTFDGTRYRVFVNGVLAGSGTTTYNLSATSTNYIGYSGNGSFTSYYTGYMQGLRVVKGGMPSAYSTSATTNGTAVFTPPTAPFTGSESLTAGSLSLLCSMTNAGIYDNAMMNNLETVGNAQVSTSVVKYGSGSLAFDGSGDRLLAPSTPQYELTTGNWTIECWVYANSLASINGIFSKRSNTDTDVRWIDSYINTSGTIYTEVSSSSSTWGIQASSTIAIAANTWNHIAWVRNGSDVSVYVNGIKNTLSSSFTSSVYNGTESFVLGANGATGSSYFYQMNGYMDDFRITKGVARYTANFQPPKVAFSNQ